VKAKANPFWKFATGPVLVGPDLLPQFAPLFSFSFSRLFAVIDLNHKKLTYFEIYGDFAVEFAARFSKPKIYP